MVSKYHNLKKGVILLIIGMIVIFNGCSSFSNEQTSLYELDKKIGQLIVVGFRGTSVSDTSSICKQVNKYNLGGIILYEYDVPSTSRPRNISSPSQTKSLTNAIKEHCGSDLLISIDEEGGFVTRLKGNYGFQKIPSHQTLGHLNNPDSTTYWYSVLASKLEDHGFNLNFAPVVDLNIDSLSPAIGNLQRSFSRDSEDVISNATIFIKEHKKVGIMCSLKHFPGHGSASTDSHLGFTDVTSTWSEEELIPYRQLIQDSTCDIIMTSHVYNSNLDSLPATLSKKIITGILRNQLNWNGVVISDDMQMGAITKYYGFERAIELAINSGIDILIFSNNSGNTPYDENIGENAFKTIKDLVKSGKISEARINESYNRIMSLKKKYGLIQE